MTKIQHDKIQILDDRQKARDKISIWFGSNTNFYHPVKEIIANSCDEIMNNFDSGVVTIKLSDDCRRISVLDSGRGIPLDGTTDGIKNYDVLFRKLFAGTKYEESEDTTTGTNGVGMAVVCMTSKYFKAASTYNNYKYSIEFHNGGLDDSGLLKEASNKNQHGTEIVFELDEEVYTETTFDSKVIKNIIETFAVASANKNIKFIYNHKGENNEMQLSSLKNYFEDKVGNQTTSSIIHMDNIKLSDGGELSEIEILLTTQPENFHQTFLNLTYLEEGGSIHNGVVYGIREYCSDYCNENKLFKGKTDRFMPSDIENSVSFIVNMFSNNVEFSNQTKLSTSKNLYREITLNQTKLLLDHFKNTDKKNFNKFIKHLLTVQSHSERNQRAANRLRSELTKSIQTIDNRVEKLVDCKTHNYKSELFIAEGDSAKGALVSARNPNFQAIYPLRGKILNCIDSTEQKILSNQVITDLVKIIGTGINSTNKRLNTFDIDNLRYGKIIIATDQDSDGSHIATLIIGMIYRLMPQLLSEGKIYLAQTPLYEIQLANDEVLYAMSENEMKTMTQGELKGKRYKISRAKGLGELDADILSKTAMNPESRTIIKVQVDDIKDLGKILKTWLGKSVDNRKEYIENNLDNYTVEVD